VRCQFRLFSSVRAARHKQEERAGALGGVPSVSARGRFGSPFQAAGKRCIADEHEWLGGPITRCCCKREATFNETAGGRGRTDNTTHASGARASQISGDSSPRRCLRTSASDRDEAAALPPGIARRGTRPNGLKKKRNATVLRRDPTTTTALHHTLRCSLFLRSSWTWIPASRSAIAVSPPPPPPASSYQIVPTNRRICHCMITSFSPVSVM
jgi:hypothetical protein